MDNSAQHEFWNGPVGERWAGRQDDIDNALRNISEALMVFAAPMSGMKVLDAGCGAGTSTLALAEAVAPGTATGMDISAPMIEAARTRAAAAGIQVSFVQSDVAKHDFKPEFDLIYSRFGVMFFAEPVAGFRNLRRALKPAGRIAFACWCAFEENSWARETWAAAKDLLPAQPPVDPDAPGPFALADHARLQNILKQAGYADIVIERLETTTVMGPTAEAAAYEALQIGPLARAARELDDDRRRAIRARIAPVLAAYASPAGITPPAACWLAGAQA